MSARESSSNGNSNGSPKPTNSHHLWRSKRQSPATLILPRTGERVHRVVTFSDSTPIDGPGEDEPLLGGSRNSRRRRGRVGMIAEDIKAKAKQARDFWFSKTGLGILKCSLAYVIGSLATFVVPVAMTLGRNDSKHMVATVTVWFHPARSAGNMAEAVSIALMAFVYAAAVSSASMAVSIFLTKNNLETLGHLIILVVFLGGGLGLVAWTKQRLGNPLVNTACSLASLTLISVITKEDSIQEGSFSYDKMLQYLKMMFSGIVITAAVSFVVRPISARRDFRSDLVKTTDLLADWLSALTRAFLSGSEEELKASSYDEMANKYKSAFTSLTKNLSESKWEHYTCGTEREHKINVRVTKCIETIAQDLRGLRSAAAIQFSLVEKPSEQPTGPAAMGLLSPNGLFSPPLSATSSMEDGPSTLSAIYEEAEDSPEEDDRWQRDLDRQRRASVISLDAANSASDIFALFLYNLGPSMKSLAFTLKEVLGELPFDENQNISINSHFRGSLEDANALFTNARKQGLAELYRNRSVTKWRSSEVAADFEEVAASCGYFSSSLQDLAEHTVQYLDVLEELKNVDERSFWERSWNWLKFWNKFGSSLDEDAQDEHAIHQHQSTEEGMTQNLPSPMMNSLSKEIEKPEKSTLRYRLWQAFKFFRRQDIKFAIKVGVGAVLFGMWSFIPSTRPIYSHWRAEWGLLSYMLVCAMTVGASNTTGFQRTWGTAFGALCALVAWIVADDNPYILGFFGWLMALFGYYIILGLGKGPMGRYILLTYNLSALYSYSLSVRDYEDDDDEGGIDPAIWEIIIHRVVAVTIGALWGMFITRLIWPLSARRKIRDGLSLLWLRMALIWKRDPLNIPIEGIPRSSYLDIRESIELQRFLGSLDAVKAAAESEFDLRGPFKSDIFERLLESTGRILDAFYAMNVVIMKDSKGSPGENELLRITTDERIQLSSRISHLFTVLASSMKLEYPLNDVLPSIEHTRDRLLAKLFHYRTHTSNADAATDEDYELLYAYTLVTGQLAQDIVSIGRDIEQLYGVLNEDSLKLQ